MPSSDLAECRVDRSAARYWIGVASREHVRVGEAGGFCQLGHGKMEPVRRLSAGDGIVYYAPREKLRGGEAVQAFVAIGRVRPGEVYEVCQTESFCPWRRDVDYVPSAEAPIRPMLTSLSFISDPRSWGMPFRRGSFEISREDFMTIAHSMGVADHFET